MARWQPSTASQDLRVTRRPLWLRGRTATESIFKITAAGAITTLYTFCALPGCADGANLDAGLIQATDGNFYGTTSAGGAYGNYGTIFKITLAGQLTTLHSFSSTDGAIPGGGLIQATDGNFYGTAGGGGANGYGTVFRITPAGQLTTLHSFNSADGANPSGVLVQGKDGSFYGTTEGGGSSNAGTIFSLSVPMTATPTPTYGTAARVFQDGGQWPDNTIYIFGDLGKVQSELVESTTSGFQAADPKITAITTVNPAGLSSGALSYSADSSDGAARGLAFRNFINNTGAPLTMKLNAVLSGYFLQEDGYTGYGSVAGAIHIFDGTTFASRVKASGETAGQFLLANYPSTTAFQGATVIDTLDNLFPGPALAGGYVALEGEPAGSAIWIANTYGIGPISGSVSTSLFTVEPQQTITVIFDVATATAGGPFGTGEVYFLDTLQPAANFFSDANGNAVSGMAAVDAPAPASLPVDGDQLGRHGGYGDRDGDGHKWECRSRRHRQVHRHQRSERGSGGRRDHGRERTSGVQLHRYARRRPGYHPGQHRNGGVECRSGDMDFGVAAIRLRLQWHVQWHFRWRCDCPRRSDLRPGGRRGHWRYHPERR